MDSSAGDERGPYSRRKGKPQPVKELSKLTLEAGPNTGGALRAGLLSNKGGDEVAKRRYKRAGRKHSIFGLPAGETKARAMRGSRTKSFAKARTKHGRRVAGRAIKKGRR